MKAYRFEGTVHQIGELQTWPSGFAKRVLVVREDGDSKWPNFAAFEVTRGKDAAKDRTKELDHLRVGDSVGVDFYVDSRENQNKPGQWFTSNRAVKVERIAQEVEVPLMGGGTEMDDVPF